MCGIVGVRGLVGAGALAQKALQRLEYRGYDSAGVAWAEEGAVDVSKDVGRVTELALAAPGPETLAVGHNRWATHGAVTSENAHPHLDATGRFAVVHNGTLLHPTVLRRELEAAGAVFRSDTDSECIVHLYGQARAGGAAPLDALRAVLDRIDGTYALLLLDAEADALLFARRGTPLVLAPLAHAGPGAAVLASDVTALIEHGRDVLYLDDGDHGLVDADGLHLYDASRRERAAETVHVEWSPQEAERSGHEHFMAKEMHEVPGAINRALGGRTDGPLDVPGADALLRAARRVVLVGCGSSLQAARVGTHLFEQWARLPASAANASDLAGRPLLEDLDTLHVVLSQSGETRDVLLAVERLRERGYPVLALTNVQGSTLQRSVPSMMLRVGPEVAVAATKSYAAQVACLAALALRTGVVQGRLPPHEAAAAREALERLPRHAEQVLEQEDELEALGKALSSAQNLFVLGRGVHAATAAEAALKFKEVTYAHAEAFDAAELKHGPQALLRADTPCLFLMGDDDDADKTLHNLLEVRARGAPVHVLRTQGPLLEELDLACESVVALPAPRGPLGAPLAAVVHALAAQLVAYHAARRLGREIDRPRNLAKSVTVD